MSIHDIQKRVLNMETILKRDNTNLLSVYQRNYLLVSKTLRIDYLPTLAAKVKAMYLIKAKLLTKLVK